MPPITHAPPNDDQLANDDRAADDRHRGRELEIRSERASGAGGSLAPATLGMSRPGSARYSVRLTWSASLQKAQIVPVVT